MSTKKIINYILFICCLLFILACETVDKPMLSNKQSKTIDLLKSAYNEELNSSLYYRSCADKAYQEGFNNAGNVFDELSLADKVHSTILKDDLHRLGVDADEEKEDFTLKSTTENLKVALDKEKTSQAFYQEAITVADSEKDASAKTAFLWIHDTEKKHIDYLINTIELQEKGKTDTSNDESKK